MRLALCLTFAWFTLYAQDQPQFDVASIKLSPPPDGQHMMVRISGGPGTPDPGLFKCQNCTLFMLITSAYNVKRFQVAGPSWLDSEHFEINAKIAPGTTKEQFRLMQQNLLAERFKLTLHRDKKEMPVYELVVAKNGPKLKESEPVAEPDKPPAFPSGLPKMGKDGMPMLPPGANGMYIMNDKAHMQASHQSMEQFINMLANQLGKPITDATGLKGKYDFSLSWAFDGMTMAGPMGQPGGVPPPPPTTGGSATPGSGPVSNSDSDSGPTLLSALQSQLGLKLESRKGPVDFLVIDHIEKTPTEN